MPLRACMEAHTDLERDAWLYWINEHFDERSLTDYYLQQIAYEVASTSRAYQKRPKKEDFKVTFERPKPAPDKQLLSKWAQSRWFGMIGFKRK